MDHSYKKGHTLFCLNIYYEHINNIFLQIFIFCVIFFAPQFRISLKVKQIIFFFRRAFFFKIMHGFKYFFWNAPVFRKKGSLKNSDGSMLFAVSKHLFSYTSIKAGQCYLQGHIVNLSEPQLSLSELWPGP